MPAPRYLKRPGLTAVLLGMWPNNAGRAISKASVIAAIERFEANGFSSHTTEGLILIHILEHCIRKEIPFTLRYLPRGGYSLIRDPQKCRATIPGGGFAEVSFCNKPAGHEGPHS